MVGYETGFCDEACCVIQRAKHLACSMGGHLSLLIHCSTTAEAQSPISLMFSIGMPPATPIMVG